MTSTRSPHRALLGTLSALFVLAGAAVVAAPPEGGSKVEISGTVTDAEGNPVVDVDVILVAARRELSLRRLRYEDRDPVRYETKTDSRGGFAFEWSWDRSYNRFDLEVGFPFRGTSGERLEVLATTDISLRVVDGGPVVVPIVLEDVALLQEYREFVASVDTPDEKRVFDAYGRPDRIDRVKGTEGREASWWYFGQGKVYRFSDGILVEVSPFDPVQPFEGTPR